MVTIRNATDTDREAICRVHVAAIEGVDSSHYSNEQRGAWASFPHPDKYQVEGTKTVFVVAETESSIVGFAELALDTGEIEKVYIHPDYGGRGVGSALVEYLEQKAIEHGITSLYVESSLNAALFYEQVGFHEKERHQKPLNVEPDTELTCVGMEKHL